MPLDVRITESGGPTTYLLKTESARIVYNLHPIVIAAPGLDPIVESFGVFEADITITGTVLNSSQAEGGITIPSKNQLEDAVVNWHDTANTITLTLSGDSYVGNVATHTIESTGGWGERWNFTLTFKVLKRS